MQTTLPAYTLNQLARAAEFANIIQRARELGGLGLSLICGSLTASANGDGSEGIAVVQTGALTVQVGDTGSPPKQFALIQGQIADYCPAITLNEATASGTRYDYVGIQTNTNSGAAITNPSYATAFFNATTKVATPGIGVTTNDSFTAAIFTGNSSPGQQATYVPAGYVALAQIEVTGSSIVNISMLLSTIATQIGQQITLSSGIGLTQSIRAQALHVTTTPNVASQIIGNTTLVLGTSFGTGWHVIVEGEVSPGNNADAPPNAIALCSSTTGTNATYSTNGSNASPFVGSPFTNPVATAQIPTSSLNTTGVYGNTRVRYEANFANGATVTMALFLLSQYNSAFSGWLSITAYQY